MLSRQVEDEPPFSDNSCPMLVKDMGGERDVKRLCPLTDSEYKFFGGPSAFRRYEAKFLAAHALD